MRRAAFAAFFFFGTGEIVITRPTCFDSDEQFSEWKLFARQVPPPPKQGFCFDCTPDFKSRMVADGRCEYPEVEFFVRKDTFGDDELVGMRVLPKETSKIFTIYEQKAA